MLHGNINKYVVFDLDETIGHFVLIRNIWEALVRFIAYNHINYLLTQHDFNAILNEFPELFRPGILSILLSLKKKKRQGLCKGIMLYTNNKYTKKWVNYLTEYIEHRLGGGIFDNIILAFKLNGEIQEPCRTSSTKKYSDVIRCCRIPPNMQIELCYFDDVAYPEMNVDNVYYLKLKPYVYFFTHNEIMHRIFKVDIIHQILYTGKETKQTIDHHKTIFEQYILKYLTIKHVKCIEKNSMEYNLDKLITKRMITHIHVFFMRFFPGYQDTDSVSESDDTTRSDNTNR